MRQLSKLIFLFLVSSLFAQSPDFYNVLDYKLDDTGQKVNTEKFQKLIDQVSQKGGTIYFPAGKYLTGSVELKSNVEIYLSKGSEILGSTSLSDYAPHKPKLQSYNDYFLLYSLFYAERAENISIRGEGTINGQGSAFKVKSDKKPEKYKDRPFIIRFVECRNVHIEGIFMTSSAMWMQQYLACEDLFISKINVYNHANKNNDMMDIDGCKNVIISDCLGDTDDDGITLKSTSPKITENIVIKNCIISSHCNALKTGTESTGGFKNIVVSNLVVKPSRSETLQSGNREGTCGINISTVDGGIVDGILVSDVIIDGPKVPIYLRLGNRARRYNDNAPEPQVGTYRNVKLSNIIAKNAGAIGCSISGIPGHPVENVSLNNISVSYIGGGTSTDRANPMPELENQYPESTMWGNLPSYGFYLRHAKGVELNNIRLSFEKSDSRPALEIVDASDIKLRNLEAKISPEAQSLLSVENGNNISIENSCAIGNTNSFISVNDETSGSLILIQNDLRNFKSPIMEKKQGQIVSFNNLGLE
ncbi:MAG: glycoside hydrolase family 28 protein [Acidobacteriota bacterium]